MIAFALKDFKVSIIKRIYDFNLCVGEHCDKMCDLTNNRLDISIVIDTSGSQIGNKQEVVQNFVKSLMNEFDTQTAVKVSITAVGDTRNGQVEVMLGPAQFTDSATLQAAIDSITW